MGDYWGEGGGINRTGSAKPQATASVDGERVRMRKASAEGQELAGGAAEAFAAEGREAHGFLLERLDRPGGQLAALGSGPERGVLEEDLADGGLERSERHLVRC